MEDRVLLVEDDKKICEIIRDHFSEAEIPITVDIAGDGLQGLEKLREREYDLVLLDLMMPRMDGFSFLREVRKNSDIPVIIITARVREDDMLKGYALRCDDYINKPFSLNVLYSKVIALIRRAKGTVIDDSLTCGSITVYRRRLLVEVAGKEVELPPKQFDLLVTLMERKDWLFTRDMLLDLVWGSDYEGTDRTVDNHIKKLRKSLGQAGNQIKTIHAKGYKISDH